MNRSTKERRSIWFWVGVILLAISALFWLMIIIVIGTEPENAGDIIIGGFILTIIPTGVGIYYVRRGKRRHKRRIFFII